MLHRQTMFELSVIVLTQFLVDLKMEDGRSSLILLYLLV